MKKTLLIQFLKSLSPAELRGFRDFVISPAFNKNNKVIELLEILKPHYPEFDNADLEESNIYSQLFKDEGFDYFRIRNLTTDLLSLGKEYLAFIQYKKDRNNKEVYLLKELAGRGLDKMFESAFRVAEERLEKQEVKDENYFFHKFRITDQIMNFHTPKRPNVNFHYHQEKLDLFTDYSNLMKLKIYNIMLHERNQNNYNYTLTMFEQVMDYLKNLSSLANPTISIYYDIVLLCTEKNDENFNRLKMNHERLRDQLGIVDDYMAFLHLDSYCATAYNIHGRTDLLRQQFELNKIYDMNNLPELGSVLYPNFLNFVKIASRVNEFEYAEEYIEKFKNNLRSERQNTVDFCYAYIAYMKKDFERSLGLLAKTNFSNYIIKLQVRLLELQLNYELGFYDNVMMMVDSFRHYLTREKLLLGIHREVIQLFLKIVADLARRKTARYNEVDDITERIEFEYKKLKTNHFGIKLWLKDIV